MTVIIDPSWEVYDHYGYAAAAVLGTGVAVLVIWWVMRQRRWAAALATLQGVAPPFINIIGVLFGLTMAFLANDTWSAHDRAMRAVYQEADGLQALATLAQPLPTPLHDQVRAALRDYARASAQEWPKLALRRQSREVGEAADTLLALLASPEVARTAGAHVQTLMLQKAMDIRDEHDHRVALSRTHVNPLKWLGMAFLGLLTLLSVAVVHLDRPRAALVALLLLALAAAPTAAIVLIQGNPFQPPTAVTPFPIEAAANALAPR